MSFSLRRRLLLFLAPSIVCVWFAATGAAAWQAGREVQVVLDASLAQSAVVILQLVAHEMAEHRAQSEGGPKARWVHELRSHLPSQPLEMPLAFQVVSHTGAVAFGSPGAPQAPLSTGEEGFSDFFAGNERWRVYTLRDVDTGVTVRVGELDRWRARLLGGILEKFVAPLVVGVPLLVACIWLSVGRGLQPLHRVTQLVAERDPSHLSPLAIHNPPAELAPLVAALDRLLVRLDTALEGERRFTADAAHELRTPLAGIRAQAQVALLASDEAQRTRALKQLLVGVDRAARLFEQLLAMARFDACVATEPAGEQADVSRVAHRLVEELQPMARRRRIQLDLHAAHSARIDVAGHAVEVMLRNLVDNAIRYSPPGGRVAVDVQARNDRVRIEITDSGPGIPPDQRQRVFERFRRGRAVDAPGSGLGLSIVARIAAVTGASVHLHGGPGEGLSVVVDFPQTRKASREGEGHKDE